MSEYLLAIAVLQQVLTGGDPSRLVANNEHADERIRAAIEHLQRPPAQPLPAPIPRPRTVADLDENFIQSAPVRRCHHLQVSMIDAYLVERARLEMDDCR
jgi:hypothetical protein